MSGSGCVMQIIMLCWLLDIRVIFDGGLGIGKKESVISRLSKIYNCYVGNFEIYFMILIYYFLKFEFVLKGFWDQFGL